MLRLVQKSNGQILWSADKKYLPEGHDIFSDLTREIFHRDRSISVDDLKVLCDQETRDVMDVQSSMGTAPRDKPLKGVFSTVTSIPIEVLEEETVS